MFCTEEAWCGIVHEEWPGPSVWIRMQLARRSFPFAHPGAEQLGRWNMDTAVPHFVHCQLECSVASKEEHRSLL